MSTSVWLVVATTALALALVYFAMSVRRLGLAVQSMASATEEMAEAAWKTYALSVVPRVECRTLLRAAASPEEAGDPPRPFVTETTIVNHGPHRLRLKSVRVETEFEGEHIRRFVDHWLVADQAEVVRIPVGKPSHFKVAVHFDDLASQSHIVFSNVTASDSLHVT
jgi:hypothetical protein